jgi:hypothetical protein
MDQDRFLNRARELAADHAKLDPAEMYVVWFCKTLQNWKALVSTDAVSGVYYEVTHNGDKREMYLDCYFKSFNAAIADR